MRLALPALRQRGYSAAMDVMRRRPKRANSCTTSS
jgi:hypothetical protein